MNEKLIYNVGIYIRLSKEDSKKGESESIINQRKILTKFLSELNFKITKEYIDDGFSGTTFDRPGFKNMLKDIENKKINMVVTKDLSRLGRDYILTGHYIEKYFPEHKVRYISVLDGIDTGSDTTLNDISPFKSVLNDMYAKDISKKIKSVKNTKQELGLFIGSKAPFGYLTKDNNPNYLYIDEEAKIIIQKIFNLASSGKSCRSIANYLNKNNIATPSIYALKKGKKVSKVSTYWLDSRIREILQNEVYIGNMVQRRMKKLNYKSKKNVRLPKEEWKIVTNTHAAIISHEQFYDVQNLIKKRKSTRTKKYSFLLRGLVFCNECNKKMGIITTHNNNNYFRCNTYARFSNLNLCSPHTYSMKKLEEIVFNYIQNIFNMLDYNKLLNITKNKLYEYISKNNFRNTNSILSKIEKANILIENLYEDKINKIISDEDFNRIYTKKSQEKSKLENELSKINNLKNNIDIDCLAKNILNNFFEKYIFEQRVIYKIIDKIEIDTSKNVYIYIK